MKAKSGAGRKGAEIICLCREAYITPAVCGGYIKKMTIKEFCKEWELHLKLTRLPFRLDSYAHNWDAQAKHFAYTITSGKNATEGSAGEALRGTYSQGSGIKGNPTASDIMQALASDADGTASTFEDWCDELGYSSDSREALKVYEACLKERQDLEKFFGSAGYVELMECERS